MPTKNLPVEQQIMLDSLRQQHLGVRAELDILRKTRLQRDVGALKVPAHLSMPLVTVIPGVASNPRQCPACGKGLDSEALRKGERVCSACASNPSTEAGVEPRAALAAVGGPTA